MCIKQISSNIVNSIPFVEGLGIINVTEPTAPLDKILNTKVVQLELLQSPLLLTENINRLSTGSGRFSGTITSKSYIHQKEEIEKSIFITKQDLIKSLKARYDLFYQDLKSQAEENGENPLSSKNIMEKDAVWILPKRIYLLSDSVILNDYLFFNETIEESKDRLSSLFTNIKSIDHKTENFPEKDNMKTFTSSTKNSPSISTSTTTIASNNKSSPSEQTQGNQNWLYFILAIIIVFVAIYFVK